MTEEKKEAQDVEFSAFGLPMSDQEELSIFDDLRALDTPEVPDELVVEPEEAPEAPAPELPVEGEEAPQEVPEAPEEEVPQTVEELIFGKYKSLDEAEKGYQNLLRLQTRTAQQRREMEKLYEDTLNQGKQYAAALQRVTPYVQRQQAAIQYMQQQLREAGLLETPVQQPLAQPTVTPQQVDRMVQQRLTTMKEALAIEADAERSIQEAEETLMGFYEKHPEVEIHGELDNQLYNTVLTLEDAWQHMGVEDFKVGLDNPDMLEIVYEAAQNPHLLTVLKKNPYLADDDEGMQLARFEAALLSGETPITQQTRQVPASQVGQRKPIVEKASVGANAPVTSPDDEWEQIKRATRQTRTERGGNPFFEA